MIRCIDIETTGLAPAEGAAICEIGWADVEQGGNKCPVDIGSVLVNPGKPIPPEISAVHHIIDADVADSPMLDRALAGLGANGIHVFAAHRASFERSFLGEIEPFKSLPWIDTWKVAMRLAPNAPSHSNQALRYWLRLDLDRTLAQPPHRAGPDAYVTAHILRRMLAKLSVEEMIKISAEPAILPKFTFGKHAMKPLAEVPSDYLEWMTRQQDMDADARATAAHHLKIRAA